MDCEKKSRRMMDDIIVCAVDRYGIGNSESWPQLGGSSTKSSWGGTKFKAKGSLSFVRKNLHGKYTFCRWHPFWSRQSDLNRKFEKIWKSSTQDYWSSKKFVSIHASSVRNLRTFATSHRQMRLLVPVNNSKKRFREPDALWIINPYSCSKPCSKRSHSSVRRTKLA